MPQIEKQPIEQRQAYAVDELSKLVEKATALEEAQSWCEQKLMEMIEQHVLPNNHDDIMPVFERVKEKIVAKFETAVDPATLLLIIPYINNVLQNLERRLTSDEIEIWIEDGEEQKSTTSFNLRKKNIQEIIRSLYQDYPKFKEVWKSESDNGRQEIIDLIGELLANSYPAFKIGKTRPEITYKIK